MAVKKNLNKFFVKDANNDIDKELFKAQVFDGVQPSPEDDRDFVSNLSSSTKTAFPEEYMSTQTEVFNQGSIGSCVAHSCATALAQGEEVANSQHCEYSRGYIYGNRAATDLQTEGMYMRQALKQLNHCGDVYYDDFPYNRAYAKVKALIEANKENLAQKALPHAILDYYRCYNSNQIKNAIMEAGGVLICVPVYSDFGRDLHKTTTNELSGYHAMIIVGWTKEGKWIVQNSWGNLWGYSGKLLMDEDYPVNEYWAITVAENKDVPKKSVWKKIWEFIVNIFTKIFGRKAS